MVQRRQRERSLFEGLLPDGHKLWPDWLRKIDALLEDEAVIEVVAQGLETRWPQSRRRGRLGTPAEVVLRMLILKHLFDWSYDDLEREVRANLVYRMLTRIDAGDVPDAKTILKIARALGPEVIAQLHRQVVEIAKRAGVTHGRRFRIDTTVVATNVHNPTDSTLLQDSVRVLTRTMQRASTALGDAPGHVRHRLRRVMRRVLTISDEARSPKTRAAMICCVRFRELHASFGFMVVDPSLNRRIRNSIGYGACFQLIPYAVAYAGRTVIKSLVDRAEPVPLKSGDFLLTWAFAHAAKGWTHRIGYSINGGPVQVLEEKSEAKKDPDHSIGLALLQA